MNSKSKIILPRGYLSWGQFNLWRKNKEQYKKQYFFGEEGYHGKEMDYGKRLADHIENGGEESEAIKMLATLLPKYSKVEHRVEAYLGDILLKGSIDTFNPRNLAFGEYKTGKVPWTQAKVDKHGQLTMYQLILYLQKEKLVKDIWLHWAETRNEGSSDIELTGKIESFRTERSMGDIVYFAREVRKSAEEISNEWKKLIA
ncbi:MAG: hypothetical protein U1C72_00110 [Candidatus Pacearchaeota archaeon]|nr:hypothetical protein [Candidatus Pacearchaeota archaeon]